MYWFWPRKGFDWKKRQGSKACDLLFSFFLGKIMISSTDVLRHIEMARATTYVLNWLGEIIMQCPFNLLSSQITNNFKYEHVYFLC